MWNKQRRKYQYLIFTILYKIPAIHLNNQICFGSGNLTVPFRASFRLYENVRSCYVSLYRRRELQEEAFLNDDDDDIKYNEEYEEENKEPEYESAALLRNY